MKGNLPKLKESGRESVHVCKKMWGGQKHKVNVVHRERPSDCRMRFHANLMNGMGARITGVNCFLNAVFCNAFKSKQLHCAISPRVVKQTSHMTSLSVCWIYFFNELRVPKNLKNCKSLKIEDFLQPPFRGMLHCVSSNSKACTPTQLKSSCELQHAHKCTSVFVE